MANSEKIDEIISPKAFEQLDALLSKLGVAQTEFGGLAKSIAELNTQISKTSSIKDLNESVKQSEKEFEKLEKTTAKIVIVRKEATKAEQDLIQSTKEKLNIDKEASKVVQEYSGSVEFLIKTQLLLKLRIKELNAEQKILDKAFQEGKVSAENYEDGAQEIAIALAEGKQGLVDFNLEVRRSLKENNSIEGSYDSVSASLDRMRGLYRRLSEEERESADIGGVLLSSIKNTDEKLKAIDKTLGITNRQVGNYKEQIIGAVDETGLFSSQLAILKTIQSQYSVAIKLATISTASFSKVLIATGIGAILILVGSLIAFITRTQKGMELLGRATEGLTTFLAVLLDGFTVLGQQIFENVIPILKGVGDILLGIATFDYDKIQEGFNGVQEAVSNIDSVNLLELGANAVKAGEEATRLKGKLQDLVREQKQIDLLKSKSRSDIEALELIAEDQAESTIKREEAAKKGLKIEQDLMAKTIALKEKELRITKEKNNLTISVDKDKDKEIDLEIELNDLKRESVNKQIELNNTLNRIRKSALEEEQAKQAKINEEAKRISAERKARAKKESEAIFNLEESRLKRSIKRNKAVAEDEKLGLMDRISNLEQYLVNEQKAIELARDFELSNKELLKDERIRITEDAENEIASLKIEGSKIGEKILKDQLTNQEKASAERVKAEIEGIKKEQAERLTALNDAFNAGSVTEKQFQEQKLSIISTYGKLALEAEIRSIEEIILANKMKGISVLEEERKLAEIKQKLSEETTTKTIEDLKKIEEQEKKLKELQGQLANELFNLGVDLIQQRFEKEEQKLAQEQENIGVRKEEEIAQIEATVLNEEEKQLRLSNAEKRAQLESEKVAEKQRQLKIKQARFDKVLAIANIIRSTAQAIIVQLAGAPFFPISGALIPIIAGIGAAQIAQVVAQDIPAFAKGTKYSPEGIAWVGEQGSEMRINPDGSEELTPDKATLSYLQKGTQIIPHKESLKLVESKRDTFDAIIFEQRRSTNVLKKELRRSRGSGVNITREGITMIHDKGKKASLYDSKLL